MGTLPGDNGGAGRPADGDGLPDLPAEWGTIVVPDDASELAGESAAVRREFRREARRNRWRRRIGRPPVYGRHTRDDESPALGLPLLIMSIAIIATLTSLIAIAWPGRNSGSRPSTVTATSSLPPTVPDITLYDSTGAAIRLRDSVPAVLLLVDDCACVDLIQQTLIQSPASATVLLIGRTLPTVPTALQTERRPIAIADPNGVLRSAYSVLGVAAILLTRTGATAKKVSSVQSIDDFQPYLSQLR